MFCPNCGTEINFDSSFCPSCGYNIHVEINSSDVDGSTPQDDRSKKWDSLKTSNSRNALKNGASRNLYIVFIVIIGGITLVSGIILCYSLGMLKAMGF